MDCNMIQNLNQTVWILDDGRFHCCLLNIGDGLFNKAVRHSENHQVSLKKHKLFQIITVTTIYFNSNREKWNIMK